MTPISRRLVHDPEALNSATWPLCQKTLLTPTEDFFTRSHAPTPAVDPAAFRLELDGLVEQPQRLSLDASPRSSGSRDGRGSTARRSRTSCS